MKYTISLIFILTLSYSVVAQKKNIIKEGIYATYYESELQNDNFQPAYNIISKNNKGFYFTSSSDNGFSGFESYTLKIKGDTLIIENQYAKWVNDKDCLDDLGKSIQYWKILKFKKNEIRLKLIENKDSNSTTNYEEFNDNYILKRVGDRI
ncbi:hypothetical protein ACU8V7_25315 [Zobellia nedashkovskayae]